MSAAPELINARQASDLLGCTPNTIRRWRKLGLLPKIMDKQTGQMLFDKERLLVVADTYARKRDTHQAAKLERDKSEIGQGQHVLLGELREEMTLLREESADLRDELHSLRRQSREMLRAMESQALSLELVKELEREELRRRRLGETVSSEAVLRDTLGALRRSGAGTLLY